MKNNHPKTSGHGGKRPGAGRKPGVPNKATAEIQNAAREYTVEALETLADVMRNSESDQARALAADKVLDRGYGKPKQPMEHSGEPIDELLKAVSGANRARETERA
jgi:hypothetical protein